MSDSRQPEENSERRDEQAEHRAPAVTPSALVFDDPMSLQSSDDTDRGWGEGSYGRGAGSSSAADLARFLDEKPPHHI